MIISRGRHFFLGRTLGTKIWCHEATMPGVFLLPSAFASDLDHTGREVGPGWGGQNPSLLYSCRSALKMGYPQFPKDYNGFIYIIYYIYILYIYIYIHLYIYILIYILPFPIELFDMAISGIPNLWQQQTHIADDIPVYLHDTPTTGFIPHSIGTTSSF